MSHGKPLAKPKLKVPWELNLFSLRHGGRTCQLLVFPKLLLRNSKCVKAWLNNACQTVCEPPKKKYNLGGRIRGIGKAIRSGKLTNGALMVKLRGSKKKKNEGSASSVETKSGSNGSTAIATLIAGTPTHQPVARKPLDLPRAW